MIISHRYKFILFAIPRTGTQSIRAALRPHLGRDDWEQADWRVRRRLPIPELARVGHGHLDARLVRPWIDETVWRSYLKATFVRDPYDRFLSAAFFRNAGRPLFQARPEAYLDLMVQHPATMEHTCFLPQHHFIDDEHGRLVSNFVGRFEDLAADFGRFCGLVGLPPITLPHLNRAPRRVPDRDRDAALRERIGQHYARDIELFRYPTLWHTGGGRAARRGQPIQDDASAAIVRG